jgi:hypothetical protein
MMLARTRSLSCGELQRLKDSAVPQPTKNLSTTDYLKFLLLKKALLVYVTLAEASYDLERFGRSLRCIKRAINCHSMIESLGGAVETDVTRNLITFALGVAGDCYLAQVMRWNNAPLYQEQYSTDERGEEGIAAEIEKYTDETERDWTIKHPKDIQEVSGTKRFQHVDAVVENINKKPNFSPSYFHIHDLLPQRVPTKY